MNYRDILLRLCINAMSEKGLMAQAYKDRLKKEFKELDNQAEHEYFVKCHEAKEKYPRNEHNLLVAHLLGLVDDFDINQPYATLQGEHPDIDIDFITGVRSYLKREWAPKQFGKDYVCEISTYTTMGIKAAILDTTRVFGLPKDDIQAITVRMADKDDDGKPLTWDKALEIYPDFKAYCEAHPDVADAAKMLVSRNKSSGIHAGGLVISNVPIADFVPLEVRSGDEEDSEGVVVAAWSEGQHAQELQPVGLIKFDLLVVDGILQVAVAAKLIKQRHGIEKISALEGKEDWSDLAYLNDPLSIAMANRADLKCVFQLSSEGIRKVIRKGGVTTFDDIPAYSSLYRPGCLDCLRKGTNISLEDGKKPIESLVSFQDKIKYLASDGTVKTTSRFLNVKSKKKKLVCIKTKSGKVLYSSLDHRIFTDGNNYKRVHQLKVGDKIATVK